VEGGGVVVEGVENGEVGGEVHVAGEGGEVEWEWVGEKKGRWVEKGEEKEGKRREREEGGSVGV
ncbi:hypothetical protein, partial [Kocuria salsicia]|uniref:hypothetical protein n=1 Tax=Kocuria salsicia TaxID=664639 RepID=UPI001C92CF93